MNDSVLEEGFNHTFEQDININPARSCWSTSIHKRIMQFNRNQLFEALDVTRGVFKNPTGS